MVSDPLDSVRQRPVWLVIALSLATIGIYPVVWIGLSWADMKRELKDAGMSPWGHALSMLVPVYGLFRLHAHFRTMNDLLGRVGVRSGIRPGLAVVGWLLLGAIGLGFVVAARGQAQLNAYLRASKGTLAAPRVVAGEWIALGLCFPITVLLLIGGINATNDQNGPNVGERGVRGDSTGAFIAPTQAVNRPATTPTPRPFPPTPTPIAPDLLFPVGSTVYITSNYDAPIWSQPNTSTQDETSKIVERVLPGTPLEITGSFIVGERSATFTPIYWPVTNPATGKHGFIDHYFID